MPAIEPPRVVPMASRHAIPPTTRATPRSVGDLPHPRLRGSPPEAASLCLDHWRERRRLLDRPRRQSPEYRESQRAWREAHRAEKAAYAREYRASHPGQYRPAGASPCVRYVGGARSAPCAIEGCPEPRHVSAGG
ncbi:hypothetical protein BH23CHL8_BH23CHL8_31110 [soil metagenome]